MSVACGWSSRCSPPVDLCQPSTSIRGHCSHFSTRLPRCVQQHSHRVSPVKPQSGTKCQAAKGAPAARAPDQAPQVVVTRERGKNGKLMKALQQRGITALELPLVETAPGPDQARLPGVLSERRHDWVALTSPEAARVFLDAWQQAGRPGVRVAVVGGGTATALPQADGLDVAFVPSKANAEHLAAELPLEDQGRVLYPASAKAGSGLQDDLAARGFSVERLDTYNTVPVRALPAADLAAAKAAKVVAFASPSAIKAWLACAGGQDAADVAVACIGSTSANAAEKLGLKRVYYPDSPGLDGFVASIVEALEACASSPALV